MLDSGLQANRIPGHPVYQSQSELPLYPAPFLIMFGKTTLLPAPSQHSTGQSSGLQDTAERHRVWTWGFGLQGMRGFLRFLPQVSSLWGHSTREFSSCCYYTQLSYMWYITKKASRQSDSQPGFNQWNIPTWRTNWGHMLILCHPLTCFHCFQRLSDAFPHKSLSS